MKDSLEEAAERFAETYFNRDEISMSNSKTSFIDGAKWQQERSYTEQDMLDYVLYVEIVNMKDWIRSPLLPREWFEQFKKK